MVSEEELHMTSSNNQLRNNGRALRSIEPNSTLWNGIDYTSRVHPEHENIALTRPLLQRRFSLPASAALAKVDDTYLTDRAGNLYNRQSIHASRIQKSRKDVVYTAENMGFSHQHGPKDAGRSVSAHRVSRKDMERTGSVMQLANDHSEDRRLCMKMRATSMPRGENAQRSVHSGSIQPVRRASSVSRAYSRPLYSCEKYGATTAAALHTRQSGGFDIASFVLAPGEQFIPTNVNVSILPCGKKAVTYTRFSQKGNGDQHEANVEIDRIIQRTNRLQESLQTLENFVKRNRSLFPDDIIIYQHIIFYLLNTDELKRMGEHRTDSEVYGVKIRERLVAPFGTDVASILKKYYSKHSDVEVEYMKREDIQRRLKQGMNEPEVSQKQPADLHLTDEAVDVNINQQNSKSSLIHENLLYELSDRKWRKHTMKESAPCFTQWLRPNSVRAGDCCRFTCCVIGEPVPKVTWYRNGEQLAENERFRFQNAFGFYSLELREINIGDSGVYTARASNPGGEVASSAKLLVHVEKECPVINQDDAITKPWFLIDANNIVVEVGQQAMFEAQATGQPMPSVKWKKDSNDVISDSRVQVISEEIGNMKLVIHNVQLSDAGVYFCVAENIKGKAKCAATLHVNEPGGNRYSDEMGDIPICISNIIRTDTSVSDSLSTQCQPPQFLHRSPLEITALESEPLTVRCIVEGNPKPVVTWYKGVRELTYSKRHRIMAEDGNSYILQINSVLQTDPGEYTVVATNDSGQDHIKIFVNVRPKLIEQSEMSQNNRKRNENELKLSRNMEQEYMPPIFIVKLPRQKTIKVGETLFFSCLVEKTELQEMTSLPKI